jgi:signal transduction histidine kinase
MRVREILERVAAETTAHRKDLDAINEIDNEISTLNLLAEELIDISNRRGRQPEILDVCEVITHCISLMERDTASRSVTVRMEVDSPAPPAFANRKDLKNIIINILANCVEAAGDDGWVKVTVGQGDEGSNGGKVEMVVTDSGPGVPEDLVGRVFDPFYTTKLEGRGIGLFSAKKRANANGGDVSCEIGEDGRSRFVISLPLAS